jgi:hypothetical protein
MKAKHHFLVVTSHRRSALLATGSVSALAGSLIGGFLIDSDHIIDQIWSMRYGAPLRQPPSQHVEHRTGKPVSWAMSFLRPRKLLRLPLVFHSYELLALITIITIVLRTPLLDWAINRIRITLSIRYVEASSRIQLTILLSHLLQVIAGLS